MATPSSRPMGGTRPQNVWGSTKVQRTLSVTEDCWNYLTSSCEVNGLNRSEWLEVMSRHAYDNKIDVAAIREGMVGKHGV